LSACTTATTHTLQNAEATGLIMPLDALAAGDENLSHQTARVELNDIIVTANFTSSIVFPIQQDLEFDATEGELLILIEEGSRVAAGDAIARLAFGMDTRLELEFFSANQQLVQSHTDFAAEQARRQAEIAAAPSGSLEQQLLQTQLARFELSSQTAINNLEYAVANLENRLLGEVIYAPFDGVITFIAHPNHNIRWNPVIATIIDDSRFYFQITIGDATQALGRYNNIGHGDILALRSTARHTVGGIEQPMLDFEAQVVSDSWASGLRSNFTYLLTPADKQGFLDDVAAVGIELHHLTDLAIMAHVYIVHAYNAPTLPSDAVRLEEPLNYVFVYNNGRLSRRYVQVGARAGGLSEILSGIDIGTEVVILP